MIILADYSHITESARVLEQYRAWIGYKFFNPGTVVGY